MTQKRQTESRKCRATAHDKRDRFYGALRQAAPSAGGKGKEMSLENASGDYQDCWL